LSVQTFVFPSFPRNQQIFRQSASIDAVREAGIAIVNHLLDLSLQSGLLNSNEEIGCVANLPDGKPFENLFESKLKLRLVEIETMRTGLGNTKIEVKKRLVSRQWGRVSEGLIVDSCIAGASILTQALIPEVLGLSNSVRRILCMVPIAAKPGIDTLTRFAKQVSRSIVVITGSVDPHIDSNGYIVPGVGPDFWTKRIPEKMGEISVWSEYLQSWAQESFERGLQGKRCERIALNAATLALVWSWQVHMHKPIPYRLLVASLQQLEKRLTNYETLTLRPCSHRRSYYDSPYISDAIDELGFLGFINEWAPYFVRPEGLLFLNRVCFPCLERDPTFKVLAEELRVSPRKLFAL